MPAYFIASVRFRNRENAEEYIAQVPAIVAAHGGRYLARTRSVEVLEGEWRPAALALIEFPSTAAAKGFYDAPEYQALKQIRLDNADSEIVMVEGV